MIDHLPIYISLIFGLTTVATLALFIWTIKCATSETTRKNSFLILVGLVIWLIIQTIITLQDVYISDINAVPPKIFLLGVLPTLLAIAALFITPSGRAFTDSLPLKYLTWINIVRIPVELVLWWLYLHKAIPELMTFEGRNFDILAGITTPLIVYFGLTKGSLIQRFILSWHIISLGLLINIVVNAFFSAPSPLQQFAFDQPNIAILYFPFSWLPSFIVPVVLFGHLASIRKLLSRK